MTAMKKIIIMLAISLMAICNTIYAEDKLTISNFLIAPGETKEVSITLENSTAYVAFQFDLYLPVGLTVEAYSADGNRIPESTMLSMAQQSDGAFRFISVATNSEPIVGVKGGIVKLTVKAADEITLGETIGYFRKVKLAEADASGVSYTEMSFPISVEVSFIPGDVNGDGKIDTVDLSLLINKILGIEDPRFISEAGDLNHDGNYDTVDLSLLINLILNQ